MPQILALLSVSIGAGHVRAAEALKVTAEQTFPELKVIHLDVMELVPDHFRRVYMDSYIHIIKHHPSLWGYLYRVTERRKSDSVLNQMRERIESLNTRKLRKVLKELQPDHVICTHFLPASLLSRMRRKGKFTKATWVLDTDFDVHKMWIYPHMSGYFAAADEVAWRMKDYGIASEQIHVTGIPIMPVFGQRFDRTLCARELGIAPQKTTILLMSGGVGIEATATLAERLLGLPHDFQILALAGNNKKLLKSLQQLAEQHPQRLFPQGFTDNIERMMAVSDLAISKPGGLTSSECLAMTLPMIVVSPIPGQEERNADYLLEHGAAMKAHDLAGLEFRVRRFLEQPHTFDDIRRNIEQIARPQAARDVLDIVLGRERAS